MAHLVRRQWAPIAARRSRGWGEYELAEVFAFACDGGVVGVARIPRSDNVTVEGNSITV